MPKTSEAKNTSDVISENCVHSDDDEIWGNFEKKW